MSLSSTSCSTVWSDSKNRPEYQGVDEKIQPLVKEYLWLSDQNHIVFYNTVTIGFKKLKFPIIGMCNYGGNFREIDIDPDFWAEAKASDRLALVFHELTHCYCNRSHDWGKGEKYPDTELARIAQAKNWVQNGGKRPGRYEDGCPTSLMYPVVLDTDCTLEHYQDYVKEMFNRCEPW